MTFFRLVYNEVEKIRRHRWWLFVAVTVLVLVILNFQIALSLARDHKMPKFGQKTDWRSATQGQLQSAESQVKGLRELRKNLKFNFASQGQRDQFLKQQDDRIAAQQRNADQLRYALEHNVAPAEVEPIVGAFAFVFTVLGFVFVISVGWLASEAIAGERSSRTLALLLARPVSGGALLAAKAAAVGLSGLVLVAITLALTTPYLYLFLGQLSDASNVAVVRDSTSSAAGNLWIMPLPFLLLLCTAGGLVGIACAGAMALAISTFAGRTGTAVGMTLGVIFGGPIIAAAINGFLSVSGGSPPDWLTYLWFQNFLPVGKLVTFFASPTTTIGTDPFLKSSAIELGWLVFFSVVAYVVMRRKQEIA